MLKYDINNHFHTLFADLVVEEIIRFVNKDVDYKDPKYDQTAVNFNLVRFGGYEADIDVWVKYSPNFVLNKSVIKSIEGMLQTDFPGAYIDTDTTLGTYEIMQAGHRCPPIRNCFVVRIPDKITRTRPGIDNDYLTTLYNDDAVKGIEYCGWDNAGHIRIGVILVALLVLAIIGYTIYQWILYPHWWALTWRCAIVGGIIGLFQAINNALTK